MCYLMIILKFSGFMIFKDYKLTILQSCFYAEHHCYYAKKNVGWGER